MLVNPIRLSSERIYDAKEVEKEAARILGKQADEMLHGPRRA